MTKINIKFFWVFAFLAFFFRWLFPGDISFQMDEAQVLLDTLKSIENGLWITKGPFGTRGLPIGPFPYYYYRVLLNITQDLHILILLHSTILIGATVFGFSKILDIISPQNKRYALLLILASPLFYHYSRMFWDNSLLIPLLSLTYGFYLSFDKDGAFKNLFLTFLFLSLAANVHIMCLPVCVAIVGHILFYHRKRLLELWKPSIPGVLCLILLNAPYAYELYLSLSKIVKVNVDMKNNYIFPLRGPLAFTAYKLRYFLGGGYNYESGLPQFFNYISRGLVFLLYLVFPITILGIVKKWKNDRISILFLINLIVFYFQFISSNNEDHPHYYNAVWIAHVFFFLKGIEYLSNRYEKIIQGIKYAHVTILFLMTLFFFQFVRHNHGSTRMHYGHRLDDLIKVTNLVSQHGKENVKVELEQFQWEDIPTVLNRLYPVERVLNEKICIHNRNETKLKNHIHIEKCDF